mmetsp:Transcript_9182/g.17512  ORF Transcript_9182/g.17512 Transcript_9182/m.17512 type:complete len:238 (-) Transcript_9182:545-1258(-)
MGTWKSKLMGGRTHGLGRTVGIKSTSAVMMHSALPAKRLTRHTMASCSGSYLARPKEFLILALEVFLGTGIFTTTCVANNWSEKLAMILTFIETLVKLASSCTAGMTLNGRLILSVTRYLINSNSPSGGINVMVRSASNLPKRTQRWKVQSSISTPGFRSSFSLSITNLSLRPNLHSGIPVNLVFICTAPETSFRKILPVVESNKLTDSRTSMYTSFFLWRIPSRRQSMAPVICDVN